MMTPGAQEIYEEAIQHIIAVANEHDDPGEFCEVFGPDDHVDYTYRTPEGKVFYCLGASLVACRLARDWWLERGCPSLLNQRFAR